jgi:hypothetical protein
LDLVWRLCHSSSGCPGSILVTSCGICGLQNDAGAGFLRVRPFTLSILTPQTAPYWSIIRGRNNRPTVAGVPNAFGLTSPHESVWNSHMDLTKLVHQCVCCQCLRTQVATNMHPYVRHQSYRHISNCSKY